ncbi:hypothetical protein A2U01_0061584, partial [Trifolium medium]|nr:hypothetical protein [Trifolium medium]
DWIRHRLVVCRFALRSLLSGGFCIVLFVSGVESLDFGSSPFGSRGDVAGVLRW